MKYPQNREETVELCRKVIPLMAEQHAGLNPLSFAVFYEHLSGLNQALSEQVAKQLSTRPLNDADIIALYETHIRERQSQRVARMLAHLIHHVSNVAEAAGADMQRFCESLDKHQHQLQEPLEQMAVSALVANLLGDTKRLRVITGGLSESLASSLSEVAQLEKRLREAESAALTDPLTGLLNRRGFEQAVSQIAASERQLDGFALIFVDVDEFKKINDQYTHTLGDKVLCHIAQVLSKSVEASDLVSRGGGDEFIVLSKRSADGARDLAERIRASVAAGRIVTKHGAPIGRISVSVGIAIASSSESLSKLIEQADSAMYRAKGSGRDRVSFFGEG